MPCVYRWLRKQVRTTECAWLMPPMSDDAATGCVRCSFSSRQQRPALDDQQQPSQQLGPPSCVGARRC